MSHKELMNILIERMAEFGYSTSLNYVRILLQEYEDILIDNGNSNIQLRNVISRLRILPEHDRREWLKSIIGEFDKDLSYAKWKEGYEQGKFEGSLEPKKDLPEIPSMVGDWIEYCKFTNVNLQNALIVGDVYFYNYANQKDFSKLKEFLDTENNQETFARAWLDGYTVEEEKRYLVKMRGIDNSYCVLTHYEDGNRWIMGTNSNNFISNKRHTRKELEEAGFGWVFDCEGVEMQEME